MMCGSARGAAGRRLDLVDLVEVQRGNGGRSLELDTVWACVWSIAEIQWLAFGGVGVRWLALVALGLGVSGCRGRKAAFC